jgi:hypothetical protein
MLEELYVSKVLFYVESPVIMNLTVLKMIGGEALE